MGFIGVLRQKFNTLIRGIRENGVIGLFRRVLFTNDTNIMGRFVELMGNQARIEGLTISLDSPAIPTINKGQFLQQRYEQAERNAVKHYLDTSKPVIELGGSVGVVACMTNRLLDNPKQHLVVEANPVMAQILQKNRDLNQCQFIIVNKAIAYGQDTITFHEYGFSSSVKDSVEALAFQRFDVATVSLKALMEQAEFTTFSLVSDIEGAEEDLIEQEPEILRNHVISILIELHPGITSPDFVAKAIVRLEDLGFKQVWQEDDVYVFNNQQFVQ